MDYLTKLPPELLIKIAHHTLFRGANEETCSYCNVRHSQHCSLSSFRLSCKAFALLGAQIVISRPFNAHPYDERDGGIYRTQEVVEAVLKNLLFSSDILRVGIVSTTASTSLSIGRNANRVFQQARESCVGLKTLGARLIDGYGFGIKIKLSTLSSSNPSSFSHYVFEGAHSLLPRDALFSTLHDKDILESAWRLELVIGGEDFEEDPTAHYALEHDKYDRDLARLLRRASRITELEIQASAEDNIHLVDAILPHFTFKDLKTFTLRFGEDADLSLDLIRFIQRHTSTLENVKLSFYCVHMEPLKLRALILSVNLCQKVGVREINVRDADQFEQTHPAKRILIRSEWEDVVEEFGGRSQGQFQPEFTWRTVKTA